MVSAALTLLSRGTQRGAEVGEWGSVRAWTDREASFGCRPLTEV